MGRPEPARYLREVEVAMMCLCLVPIAQAHAPGFKVIVAATRQPDH